MPKKNHAGNRFILILLLIAVSFLMVDCSESDVIEIGERMFIGQVNAIYMNADDFLGKTIKLQGIFKRGQWEAHGEWFYFVLRYGPGCCGDDGNVGFEVKWSDSQDYPPPESWVEAVGILKSDKVNDSRSYIYLDLISLTVLDKRGEEFVRQ